MRARAEVLATIRAFFADRGVLEVATPILAPCTVTEPHIDSIAVPGCGYLQTSPEYQMKRLLAAGAGDMYQLGPVFRAGEFGRLHNPEFLMLEWYRLGWDDGRLMAEVADLVNAVLGDAATSSVRYDALVGRPDDLAYAEACEALAGRWFVTHFPKSQAALARLHDDGETAARFELIIDGVELANGYHELADAHELAARFEADNALRATLGKPQMEIDQPFLAAMRAGMPECAGVALGVDRLVMLKAGAASLDEVIPFR